jgi:hypothetical protein
MRVLLCLVSCLLALSCAGGDKSAESSAPKTMSERFNGGPVTRSSEGKWSAGVEGKMVADAGKQSAYFTGDSKLPKTYRAGEFAKQQWWGGKGYDTKAYQGTPDGSRFQTAARDQGTSAREGGTAAKIAGPYQTAGAREASARQLDKTSDPATAIRRGTFPQPDVQGWEQQRQMDVKTVNSILGN